MGSLDCLVFTASHASTSRELKVVNGNFTHAGFLDLNMRNEIHEKFISLFISLTIYQSVYIYIIYYYIYSSYTYINVITVNIVIPVSRKTDLKGFK